MRLIGIDAPERRQLCRDRAGNVYRCGLAATAALIDEIAGAKIRCRGDAVDRYGRLLATCWKGARDLNAWLVARGWAVAYRHFSTVYVSQEDQARMTKAGIWAGAFEMPWDWRRHH